MGFRVAAIQPVPSGHFLTNTELNTITDVACLQAKQLDPTADCNSLLGAPHGSATGIFELNAGNFPRYNSPLCNSDGEFFCDPQGILSSKERKAVTEELAKLRRESAVDCGRLSTDAVDPQHLPPFYLGVVLLPDSWPSSESGPEALQTFGQIVQADWNMNGRYGGSRTQPYLRCPNSAVFIVFPGARQAYLSTTTCAFLCGTRGGPEIVSETLMGLDHGGAVQSLILGMRKTYNLVNNRSVGQYEAPVTIDSSGSGSSAYVASNTMQRAVFGLSVAVFVIALAFGIILLLVAPGLLSRRRK